MHVCRTTPLGLISDKGPVEEDFSGIDIIRTANGIDLSQQKYAGQSS